MNRIVRSQELSVAIVLAVGLLMSLAAAGQEGNAENHLRANAEDLAWWRDARFGMFVHWGPVSLKGKEISWSRAGERRGATDYEQAAGGEIPAEVYDTLYRNFNPVEFDAREWVAIAQAAGMKYLVFTSKHHDGFSMFDSELTDYSIAQSPFGRDIVGELAEACHEAGLRFGIYYSPPDWHHVDYRTENHQRYIDFLHGQLRELCTNYGRVDIVWFDGLRCKAEDWDSEKLFKTIRELQPRVLINNRAGLPGDFGTPEQTVGGFQTAWPWESCITIGGQWSWRPNDTVKPLKDCVHLLVRCAGGDGNLLLNVGPMPTGEIESLQVERLREMGAWLKRYGEAVYGTRGGPFLPGPWGASTHRGNTVYLHILDWPAETLILPAIAQEVVSVSLLGSAEGPASDESVWVDQSVERVEVRVAPERRHPIDTIVALMLAKPFPRIRSSSAAPAAP